MMGQRRGSTCRVTITEVTVLLNDNLKEVWEGSRMIGGKRIDLIAFFDLLR
jgi:hypothetical protein